MMRKIGLFLAVLMLGTFAAAQEGYDAAFEQCREAGKLEDSNPREALRLFQQYERKRDQLFNKNPGLKNDSVVAGQERLCTIKKEKILWNISSPILDEALAACDATKKAMDANDFTTASEQYAVYQAKRDEAKGIFPEATDKLTVKGSIKICDDLSGRIAEQEKAAAAAKAAADAKRRAEQAKEAAARQQQQKILDTAEADLKACSAADKGNDVAALKKAAQQAGDARKALEGIDRTGVRPAADVANQAKIVGGGLAACQAALQKRADAIVKEEAERKAAEERERKEAMKAKVDKVNQDMLSVVDQCNALMSMKGIPESLDFFMAAEKEIATLLNDPDLPADARTTLSGHKDVIDQCKKFINQIAPGLF